MSDSDEPRLCPSARCEDGSILLGVIQPDGRVGYFGGKMVVEDDFCTQAKEGRAPERRFRFANRCVEAGCKQWSGTRCGVIDRVTDLAGKEELPSDLPECGVRDRCRWFYQSGSGACRVCQLVVTDTTLVD